MNISRRSFVAGATGLVSALGSLGLLAEPQATEAASVPIKNVTLPPIRLRGHGMLSATFRSLHGGQSSVTHITCQSPRKALLVQAKYLSDLTRLPGTHADTLSLGGRNLSIHRTSHGGAVACFARGNDVLILAAASAARLRETCETPGLQIPAPADFQARVPVPMFLDRWDKYGLLIYYGPFEPAPNLPRSGEEYDYAGDLKFVKDNDTGLAPWDAPSALHTAEGLTRLQAWGWIQENARRMGIPVHVETSNDWPMLWLSNRYRDETQLKMPQFVGGYYDVGWMSGTMGAISWNSEAGEDALLGIFQHAVRRFAGDPNIVGWMEPHAETSHTPSAQFCEYGPVADRSLRRYLRERYGKLSLVSQRWTGDPRRYKAWSDVRAPEMAEFAGFGPEAIDLRGSWRIHYVPGPNGQPLAQAGAQPPTDWLQPGFDDSGWDTFLAPGNDRVIRMPRNPLVYRRTVDVPAQWLAGHKQVTLYVWDLSDRPDDELILYVNGIKIPWQRRVVAQTRWAFFDVTKALKSGPNLIAFNEPKGILCYRVYLTTVPPNQYPDLGPQKNAQWADYNGWTLWSRQAQMRRGVEMIRQADPDRSINFMSPGEDAGTVTEICKQYFPWESGMTDRWQRGGYESGWNPAQILRNYCPRDMVDEEALGAALARRYRVIIDSNTTFVNDDTLSRIENYVRAGGVFVTFGETGRHGEVEPDTWPISRLTGYQVLNAHANRSLSLAPGQTVLSGPILTNTGVGGQSMKKVGPECRDLLVAADGTTGVGMRPLGKGWIVHMGAAMGNAIQAETLHQLLSHFGARNRVPARVTLGQWPYFRHFIGNTGLHDVWVLFNDSERPITTDLTFLPGIHPPSLTDIVTGTDVPMVRDAAGDVVRGIALAPRQTVMYVSPRRDVAASPLEWLTLQRNWWQGTTTPPIKHLPTPLEQQRFSLDLTRDWSYKRMDDLTDANATALAQPVGDDHGWERRDLDVWLTPGDPKPKRIFMRRKFTVPAHWTAGMTFLNAGRSIGGAVTSLDGKAFDDGRFMEGAPFLDLSETLKPGTAHLLTLELRNRHTLIGVTVAPQLYHIPDPRDRQDLAGEWTTYSNAWHPSGTLMLPGHTTQAEFLSRTVTIDRAHKDRNVVVYVKNGGNQIWGIITNGHRLDAQWPYILINITPFIRFGEENTIEIVFHDNEKDITVSQIELRYYDPGFYP